MYADAMADNNRCMLCALLPRHQNLCSKMEKLTMVNRSVFSVDASNVATLKIDMSKLIRGNRD